LRRRVLKAVLGSAALATLGLGTTRLAGAEGDAPAKTDPMAGEAPDWRAFTVEELTKKREKRDGPFFEFLRVPSMSCGIYSLAAGAEDRQQPHRRDELYCILAGKAVLAVADARQEVSRGSLVYVKAGVEHRFHSIEEHLQVLVIFAAT
jgi:mannose-6-phosphate isomerase-like protein (cupin superfamily)